MSRSEAIEEFAPLKDKGVSFQSTRKRISNVQALNAKANKLGFNVNGDGMSLKASGELNQFKK
jgi:hypothetical protein